MKLIAIDPGLRHLGVAEFENGELMRAFLVKNPAAADVRGPAAWREYRRDTKLLLLLTLADVVVVELQQIYRTTPNPDDLLQVNGVAGVIAGYVECELHGYLPREWKGNTPKDVHHKRILDKLSTREASGVEVLPKSLLHNALDAVGLGLFHLGRMGRGK